MPEGIEPFIHNGTTYLPVRALAEALGQEVDWDQETATVLIASHLGIFSASGNVDIMDFVAKTPVYNGTLNIQDLFNASNHIKVRQQDVRFKNIITDGMGELLLNSDYAKLKATLAIADNGSSRGYGSVTIDSMNSQGTPDKRLFKTGDYADMYGGWADTINGGFEPFEIELDVIGVDNLRITLDAYARLLNVELVPLGQ